MPRIDNELQGDCNALILFDSVSLRLLKQVLEARSTHRQDPFICIQRLDFGKLDLLRGFSAESS